ncbi:MAG: transporter [Cyclobacteriaceae bacterium]
MTDAEFDILDELYFVTSYHDLSGRIELRRDELNERLINLFNKGWVRAFKSPNDTRDFEVLNAEVLSNCYLLASKAGLKAHNSA